MRACERTRKDESILAFLLDEDARFLLVKFFQVPFFHLSSVRSFQRWGRGTKQKCRNKSDIQRLRDTLTTRKRRIESRFFDGSRSLVSRTIDNLEQNRAARGSKLILGKLAATVGGTSGPRGGPRACFTFTACPSRRDGHVLPPTLNSLVSILFLLDSRLVLRSIVKINRIVRLMNFLQCIHYRILLS